MMLQHCYIVDYIFILLAWIYLATGAVAASTEVTLPNSDYTEYVSPTDIHILTCNTVVQLEGDDVITSWYKNDQPLPIIPGKFDIVNETSLQISGFTQSDEGSYFCRQTGPSGSLLSPVTSVQIKVRTELLFEDTLYKLTQGESVRLQCPVGNWNPKPNIQWYLNAEVYHQNSTQDNQRISILPNGALHITDIQESEAGVWNCAALDKDGEIIDDTDNNVTITLDPSTSPAESSTTYRLISRPAPIVNLLDGDALLIECFIQPKDGEFTEWQHKGETTSTWLDVQAMEDTEIKANQYLLRRSVTLRMAGSYRCVIKSKDGEVLRSDLMTLVTVGAPPKFRQDPSPPLYKQVSVDMTRMISLNCSISSLSSDEPRLTWLRNGEPVKLCHNNKVLEDGTLKIEQASTDAEGFYQCLISNDYGSLMYTYLVRIVVYPNVPQRPVITDAVIVEPSYIRVNWSSCATPGFDIIAFTLAYVAEKCVPDNMALTSVSLPMSNCQKCPNTTSNCLCCTKMLELLSRAKDNYTVQAIAYSSAGGAIGDVAHVLVQTNKTSPTQKYVGLGLKSYDFGIAIIMTWDMVQSDLYRVSIQHQFHEGDQLIHSQHLERIPSQEYAVIRGFDRDTTLSIEVEADTDTVKYKERTTLTTNSALKATQSSPSLAVVPDTNEQNLMIFWNMVEQPDHYLVWYKCDDMEILLSLPGDHSSLTIPGQVTHCDILVAPIIDGQPLRATSSSYDRWCKELPQPTNLEISSNYADNSGSPFFHSIELKWELESGKPSCEVNYLVQWKDVRDLAFSDVSSLILRKGSSALVEGLFRDVTYEFRVTAVTQANDEVKHSGILTYTVGPPMSVGDLQIDLSGFYRDQTVVTWSAPTGPHDISVYVILLTERSVAGWKKSDSKTVSFGSELRIEYTDLSPSTLYNVSVIPINLHGPGAATSQAFWTPELSIQPVDDHPEPESYELSATHLGIIIGVSLVLILLFIIALVFVLHKRRVKFVSCLSTGGNRRSINHLENGGEYIISSESPYQATTIPLNDVSESTPLQVDVDCDLPPLKSMSSPIELSHKATSAQDSGIADDHRSSQDLGEYETEGLMNSCLSLDNVSNDSPSRWSCGPENRTSRSESGLPCIHRDSETDSLLVAAKRQSLSLNTKQVSLPHHVSLRPKDQTNYDVNSDLSDDTQTLTDGRTPSLPSLRIE